MRRIEDDTRTFGKYGDPTFNLSCPWCGIEQIKKGWYGSYCSIKCFAAGNYGVAIGLFWMLAFVVYVLMPFVAIAYYLPPSLQLYELIVDWIILFAIHIVSISLIKDVRKMRDSGRDLDVG